MLTAKELQSLRNMGNEAEAAADEIERLRADLERLAPMSMALCERHLLVLRVGQPYVFRPVGDCTSCAAAVEAARDAYGDTLGAPNAVVTGAQGPALKDDK